jgi:hypothetical protein
MPAVCTGSACTLSVRTARICLSRYTTVGSAAVSEHLKVGGMYKCRIRVTCYLPSRAHTCYCPAPSKPCVCKHNISVRTNLLLCWFDTHSLLMCNPLRGPTERPTGRDISQQVAGDLAAGDRADAVTQRELEAGTSACKMMEEGIDARLTSTAKLA